MTQKEKYSLATLTPLNHSSAGRAEEGLYGYILNHSEVRLKGRSSSLNISGDWLKVN